MARLTRLAAAEARYNASADRTTKAELDLVDHTQTGGTPAMTPAKRIEMLTDEVVEKMRRGQH